jgi:hypothetical protein
VVDSASPGRMPTCHERASAIAIAIAPMNGETEPLGAIDPKGIRLLDALLRFKIMEPRHRLRS